MSRRLFFPVILFLSCVNASGARADIPVIDGHVETERSARDHLTSENRDIGRKTYQITASVTCSMYKRGRRDDPVSAAVANPEISGLVRRIARQEGVSETQMLALVYQESRFNPCAQSGAGAIGLAQLMPGTAKDLGVNPHDIEENIRGGARYFKQQLRRYGGNVNLALAAYNAGAGNVNKWGGIPPFKETQNYVANITEKWIPALGGSDLSKLPLNYGGGTAAFASARSSTLNAFANSAAVSESSGNISSWLQQLSETPAGTLEDSWDQNSASRNANIALFNQMIGLGISIADLLNAQNTLRLSDLSGTSQSLTPDRSDDNEKLALCDKRQNLVWDDSSKTCVPKIPTDPLRLIKDN